MLDLRSGEENPCPDGLENHYPDSLEPKYTIVGKASSVFQQLWKGLPHSLLNKSMVLPLRVRVGVGKGFFEMLQPLGRSNFCFLRRLPGFCIFRVWHLLLLATCQNKLDSVWDVDKLREAGLVTGMVWIWSFGLVAGSLVWLADWLLGWFSGFVCDQDVQTWDSQPSAFLA